MFFGVIETGNTLYVFACEKCHTEVRHVTSIRMQNYYSDICVTCGEVKRFKFLRDGNTSKDRFTKTLIQNQRRRTGDHLHKTKSNRKGMIQPDTKVA